MLIFLLTLSGRYKYMRPAKRIVKYPENRKVKPNLFPAQGIVKRPAKKKVIYRKN